MKDIMLPTMEELKKRRSESLRISEKAISEHPNEYREIKTLVSEILSKPVDIGDYYKTARKLAGLLEKMIKTETVSIFYYYYKNIDPRKSGQARYFRANCLDLYEQLKYVNELRIDRRKMRLIQ
ncbi:MAG: hypothetical protein ACKVE4_05335 [Dissulfuribacterales bacterium]